VPRLPEAECKRRFAVADHLVLGTVHPERGVDLVPVVAAVEGDVVWIPIDAVKPKSSPRLQRLANIERDPRVTLLAEHYDDDWAQLWWVRANGKAHEADAAELARGRRALAARYPAYADLASVTTAIVVAVEHWSGWSAQPF
jgi:PPOX class probable F420-dependent enzyme